MGSKKAKICGSFLSLTALLSLLVLAVGTAFARYYTATEAQLVIGNAAEMEQVYFQDLEGALLTDGAWKRGEGAGSYYLDFLLSNGNGAEQYVQQDLHTALRVAATLEEEPAETKVQLLVGSEVYTGAPEPILAGTLLGRQYGEGQLYRFFNEAGEEVSWHLRGGRFSQLEMRLLVTGGAEGTVFTLMTARASER